jgi:hypothetical protein
MTVAHRRAPIRADHAEDRLGDLGPQLEAVGALRMQRAPILSDVERRGPVFLNQDRGQLIDFLIGHPMM